ATHGTPQPPAAYRGHGKGHLPAVLRRPVEPKAVGATWLGHPRLMSRGARAAGTDHKPRPCAEEAGAPRLRPIGIHALAAREGRGGSDGSALSVLPGDPPRRQAKWHCAGTTTSSLGSSFRTSIWPPRQAHRRFTAAGLPRSVRRM